MSVKTTEYSVPVPIAECEGQMTEYGSLGRNGPGRDRIRTLHHGGQQRVSLWPTMS